MDALKKVPAIIWLLAAFAILVALGIVLVEPRLKFVFFNL